ncbi:MAG: cupin domain-containing protein [Defluviitaleaceae bacterium]|nr:cupin domain-containing protein [Defluviitaleaceae bacterium]
MIRRKDERLAVINENMRGGNGSVALKHIANKDELNEKGRLYSHILLAPGCSIGYHVHENETEIYYILFGKAAYDDNGTAAELNAGDVTFTPSGEGHSIANAGEEDLELAALILFS